jgi:hypothetical protein
MTEDSGTFKTNSADFTPIWQPLMNETMPWDGAGAVMTQAARSEI